MIAKDLAPFSGVKAFAIMGNALTVRVDPPEAVH